MKKSRFSEHQIITILKSGEAGRTAKDVCREHGISSATFYAWKSKFGGMEASDIKRIRDLEHENVRLKQMYAELSLENRPLKDVIEKSSEANRIYRQQQLNMRRKGKRRLPSRAPVRLEAQTVVNGCWSVDFMGDALMHGQRVRTFTNRCHRCEHIQAFAVLSDANLIDVTRVQGFHARSGKPVTIGELHCCS